MLPTREGLCESGGLIVLARLLGSPCTTRGESIGGGWPYALALVLSYGDLDSLKKGIGEFGYWALGCEGF